MRLQIFAASAALLFFSCFSPNAKAETFSFTVNGTGVSGSGILDTAPSTVPNAQEIVGITGTVNGFAINQLVPGSYDPANPTTYTFPDTFYSTFDNLLYTSGPLFDQYGLFIGFPNGAFFNFFTDPTAGSSYIILNGDLAFDQQHATFPVPDTFTVTPVSATPEPSSFLLLGTGLLGAGGLLRRRRA